MYANEKNVNNDVTKDSPIKQFIKMGVKTKNEKKTSLGEQHPRNG